MTIAGWYLPDFYLPEQKYWIEIKGQRPTVEDEYKTFYFDLDVLWADIKDIPDDEFDDFNDFHRVFVFAGDIPWPYPSKGNAIEASDFIGDFRHRRYCWQQCPVCRKLGIGEMGEPFCPECLERLRNAMSFEAEVVRLGRTTEPEALSEAAGEVGRRLVNTELFRSGHKSPRLQEAYKAAKSARFEHGESP